MQRSLSCLILRHFKQFVTFASLTERFPLLWNVHLQCGGENEFYSFLLTHYSSKPTTTEDCSGLERD